jgi:hypothetical protein
LLGTWGKAACAAGWKPVVPVLEPLLELDDELEELEELDELALEELALEDELLELELLDVATVPVVLLAVPLEVLPEVPVLSEPVEPVVLPVAVDEVEVEVEVELAAVDEDVDPVAVVPVLPAKRQVPSTQAWVLAQDWHDAPSAPQCSVAATWQLLSASQQPEQLVASQVFAPPLQPVRLKSPATSEAQTHTDDVFMAILVGPMGGPRCSAARVYSQATHRPVESVHCGEGRIQRGNMKNVVLSLLLVCGVALPTQAHAFCGFFVGKAGAELYNHASQVVIVRDGPRTVLTMSNDFQGSLKDFAMVVPVPTVLAKEQLHVGDRKLIERLDAFSSPRLVEYFDPNPCEMVRRNYSMASGAGMAAPASKSKADAAETAAAFGVKIEAQYTVGEYDINILSAQQSDGLAAYLKQEGYALPARAAAAIEPYLKQGMKFFVAKVNLKEQQNTGFSYLRPLQMAYESEKFMLPIRLGMANAKDAQDLVVYTLTKNGRVESTNYKTVKVPSDVDVPLYVKDEFSKFYPAVFERAHAKENYRAVHTEYVWNTGWCDPCADSPLTPEELRGLGVFWLGDAAQPSGPQPQIYRRPYPPGRRGLGGGGQPILTRLHVRYDNEHFPEDLLFQETGDQQNFQARYILRHPAKGDLSCEAGQNYLKQLHTRQVNEITTLADLTGWKRDEIARKANVDEAPASSDGDGWYKNLWK